jgi:hypothetical protein
MEYREFVTRSSLTRQEYKCRFVYLQTAISLRHSDTVDAKFQVDGSGVVVALPHTAWSEYQKRTGQTLPDELAATVAALLLQEALERGDAIELLDLNPTAGEVVDKALECARIPSNA